MRYLTVKCPKCGETLEIDAQSGQVVRHHGEQRPKADGDFLGTRLRELEQEKARREALVAEGRQKEQARSGEFEKLFRKVKEESASGKAEKPVRDIDID
jgi:hypothetical protein